MLDHWREWKKHSDVTSEKFSKEGTTEEGEADEGTAEERMREEGTTGSKEYRMSPAAGDRVLIHSHQRYRSMYLIRLNIPSSHWISLRSGLIEL